MTIVEKVKELNLPFGQYVVIGSGLLEALGIRKAQDIDVAVLPNLYDRLRASGEWGEEEKYGKIFLVREGIEISPKTSWDEYTTTTEEAIASAMIIDGVPFMSPKELIKFKTAMGRELDFRDIDLLNEYLEKHRDQEPS
ncbi:MAG: hypothetical protein WDN10_00315 [bacterium]